MGKGRDKRRRKAKKKNQQATGASRAVTEPDTGPPALGEPDTPVPAGCPRFAPRFWALTWAKEYPFWPPIGFLFTIYRCPFRFDFDHSYLSKSGVTVTAPLPILRLANQTTLHRVLMQIDQFDLELSMISNISVVIAFLPEASGLICRSQGSGPLGEGEFQIVKRVRQSRLGRLAQ